MELYLYDFPIVVRSEMDDLYKTVYDLKRKVRNLEKQVEEVRA
jgi:polyhydroxyalkanoate synthesis regulator phasin